MANDSFSEFMRKNANKEQRVEILIPELLERIGSKLDLNHTVEFKKNQTLNLREYIEFVALYGKQDKSGAPENKINMPRLMKLMRASINELSSGGSYNRAYSVLTELYEIAEIDQAEVKRLLESPHEYPIPSGTPEELQKLLEDTVKVKISEEQEEAIIKAAYFMLEKFNIAPERLSLYANFK